MKRKLSVILIILVMSFIFLGHTLAASGSDVKVNVLVSPNNPTPGSNVSITISLSELKIGIAQLSFAFNYESSVFEYVGATPGDGWTSNLYGTTYFVGTSDLEDTTQTGTILTINLKVKDDVEPGTQSEITLTSLQASVESGLLDDFSDLSETITISRNGQEDPSGGNNVGGNNTQGGQTDGNTVGGNNTQGGQTGGNNTQGGQTDGNNVNGEGQTGGNDVDGREPTVNTLPIEKINEIGNYTTEDKEVPTIPKTGESFGIQISIIGITILSIVSYVIYRKNKI